MKLLTPSRLIALLLLFSTGFVHAAEPQIQDVLQPENLAAWCIVPFDARHRTPAQRAAMLKELGIRYCAYDWRAEHVPTFEDEILEYKKHGIEMFAFWGQHDQAFALFQKYDLHPQIWQMPPNPAGDDDASRTATAVAALTPLAKKTQELGYPLGLYNHGNWGGEPKNLVAICEGLRQKGFSHVGIVYNFHHGHGHIQDWPAAFALMKPYLHCLNINGMNASGTPKILGVGKGEHELDMLKVVVNSDYRGRIGILNHREELDAREGLLENLEGVKKVRQQLSAKTGSAAEIDVAALASESAISGNVQKGATLFSSAKLACLQCHKVGDKGGTVGPALTTIGKEKPISYLIESVVWPKKDVKPEYVSWNVATARGDVLTGYKRNVTDEGFDLFHPATGETKRVKADDVDEEAAAGTLMPDGLTAAMSPQDRLDLFRFLSELGRTEAADLAAKQMKLPVHSHSVARFPIAMPPLHVEDHLLWELPVNNNRMYDFYAKEAAYFRDQETVPPVLMAYPGLDGGNLGHWGRQSEAEWRSEEWNESDQGSLQSGVFHSDEQTIPRGLCVRLGDKSQLSACFNPDTLNYEALWTGGFVARSPVRFGFMGGINRVGTLLPTPAASTLPGERIYQGLYRHGDRVVFAYRIGATDYLDAPWATENGEFVREVAPVEQHSLKHVVRGGPLQWPEILKTKMQLGPQQGYAIDTIEVPFKNPWKALFYFGGVDFLSDGSAMLCTMQGDVWHVTGFTGTPAADAPVQWKRYASGLHQAQGLVVADNTVYVLGRDMITRLQDRNGDGEADFYECFSKAFVTSPAGHDFICGMERDRDGNFYIGSGNQGLVKISSDGKQATVIATGFRNPDGLGILPDGTLTVPCSEGNWTPASMVCSVPNQLPTDGKVPHYGFGGPKEGQVPSLPLFYLPRGIDNSSGGQVFTKTTNWGPMQDHLIHFSYGTGTYFLVLEDEVRGQKQGAAVLLPGDFRSGCHRGRMNPVDGQMYVAGMNGWTCFTPDNGSFQRVRFTGDKTQLPVGYHAFQNGVTVTFSEPVDPGIISNPKSLIAQCWNYRYSPAYGSAEFSPSQTGIRGHDHVVIDSVQILPDGKTVFFEMRDLQPTNQLHLQVEVDNSGRQHDLIMTLHALDEPFTQFADYRPVAKSVAPHPIIGDMNLINRQIPNPWRNKVAGARSLVLQTGSNLTFAKATLKAKAGEMLQFSLRNPDVVPHNWALVKPGMLQKVGEESNALIADPDAYLRHYVPESEDVLVYTDIVDPDGVTTIYFEAPKVPGKYPYLCTFPGHWMVMNGVLIVE